MQGIVEHPRYGRGEILSSRNHGFELLVRFSSGLSHWVRFDEVEEVLAELSIPSSSHRISSPTDSSLQYRRMVEAFRLGIVPYEAVGDFTFGRDHEINQLMLWLDEPDAGTHLVVGQYGTGKTHLLHYLCFRALREGYAVATVEMDPNEVPFHKPKRVYSCLVRTLRYISGNGTSHGFREFLKELSQRGALIDHPYFQYLVNEEREVVWNWIEASEAASRPSEWRRGVNAFGYLPGLDDYTTSANVYCNLLSALSWAAKAALGLKGMLLIFDEAEVLSRRYYHSYQREKAYNLLKALIRTATSEELLLSKPWRIWRSIGLEYRGAGIGSDIPFLYQQPSALKLLFAFTPTDVLDRITELRQAPRLELHAVSDEALKSVFEHICLVYDQAYNFLEEDLTIDDIFQHLVSYSEGGRTRLFIKGSIEALDLVRFGKGASIVEVLQ